MKDRIKTIIFDNGKGHVFLSDSTALGYVVRHSPTDESAFTPIPNMGLFSAKFLREIAKVLDAVNEDFPPDKKDD